ISLNFNVLSINLTILDPTPYTVPLRVLQAVFPRVFQGILPAALAALLNFPSPKALFIPLDITTQVVL
ncbi:MAG: hypothetical protein ABIK23_06055, partial [candidate division WOR-3 bacterium]